MAETHAIPDERLLRALAEQLKLPLLQIARTAEFAHETGDTTSLASISYIAETALRFVDGFLLSADRSAQEVFELEPVSVSSILNDTAHKLAPLAKQNNCDIEISLHGKYGPVMAHTASLESALMLLGYGMIEARTSEKQRHRVILAAHKSIGGLVAGVFDNQPGLSADMFRRGQALYGSARQTMPAASATNGASVFVADTLFKAMAAPLHVARHDKLTGLAATLHPSSQMQLVS
jgi:hypothetical protein